MWLMELITRRTGRTVEYSSFRKRMGDEMSYGYAPHLLRGERHQMENEHVWLDQGGMNL